MIIFQYTQTLPSLHHRSKAELDRLWIDFRSAGLLDLCLDTLNDSTEDDVSRPSYSAHLNLPLLTLLVQFTSQTVLIAVCDLLNRTMAYASYIDRFMSDDRMKARLKDSSPMMFQRAIKAMRDLDVIQFSPVRKCVAVLVTQLFRTYRRDPTL